MTVYYWSLLDLIDDACELELTHGRASWVEARPGDRSSLRLHVGPYRLRYLWDDCERGALRVAGHVAGLLLMSFTAVVASGGGGEVCGEVEVAP